MNENLDIRGLEEECRVAREKGLLHGMTVAAGTRCSLDVLWSWGDASIVPAKKAMRPEWVFDVASLTKVVATASACAICVDRGLLDPDAPARAYLPGLAQFQDSVVRVRDLACHCSGYDNRKFDEHSPGELVRKAIELPAQWPPRERYEYSCRNFIVLGAIVERVAGESLAAFCEKTIFAPLGMTRTAFGPIRAGLETLVPTSQPAGVISDEQARQSHGPVGNAGLFSNAPDLAAFCRMVLQGGKVGPVRIFADEALAWLTRPCNPAGLALRSFGWDMRSCGDCLHRPAGLSPSAIGHSGWTGQSLWIDPDSGLYVVVLTNRTHAPRNGSMDTHGASELARARIATLALSHLAKPSSS